MNYRFVGNIAGTENATVKATLSYLTDYRDPEGRVPPPVLLFEKRPGQEWTGQPGGGPAWVWGPSASTDPTPRVRVTYTVLQSGLPPFARVLERRIMPNTDTPGYWDFTRGDEAQPLFVGGSGTPTPIEVLPGQGPAGERGPGWLFGQGVPSPASGRNGDLYLDLSGWDVYTRSGGGWMLGGNLKGATGGVGAQGPKGTDGKGFPLPSEAQLGFIPVADGSQPAGFGWHAPTDLRLRLRDLTDIDLSGLADGHTLVWSAAARKWKPGKAAGGTTPPPAPVALENGVPITVSGPKGSDAIFTAEIPPGTGNLIVTTSDGTGDVDVFVRHGAPTPIPSGPSDSPPPADAYSNEIGNDERVTIVDPAEGIWYVTLYAFEAYTDVTLTATWSEAPAEPFVVATNPDGTLSSNDPRITSNPDGSLSAPDELITVNDDDSLSEV